MLWSAENFERGFALGDCEISYCPNAFWEQGSTLQDSPSMLPNQARYHLRYTREYPIIINESSGDCNPQQNVLQSFHDPKGE